MVTKRWYVEWEHDSMTAEQPQSTDGNNRIG